MLPDREEMIESKYVLKSEKLFLIKFDFCYICLNNIIGFGKSQCTEEQLYNVGVKIYNF